MSTNEIDKSMHNSSFSFRNLRIFLAIMLGLILAACQTTQASAGFSAAQVKVLESAGFQLDGGNYTLGLSNRVLFDFDKSELRQETVTMLGDLATSLLQVGIMGVDVEGHTDSQGDVEYNRVLSLRRADRVKEALMLSGMSADAIRSRGMGESDPIENNETEEGRRENRRVVIIVTPARALPV